MKPVVLHERCAVFQGDCGQLGEILEPNTIDAIVTLVDARHFEQHLKDMKEPSIQVGFADVVLLNKTDLVEDLAEVIANAVALAGDVPVATNASLGQNRTHFSRTNHSVENL